MREATVEVLAVQWTIACLQSCFLLVLGASWDTVIMLWIATPLALLATCILARAVR